MGNGCGRRTLIAGQVKQSSPHFYRRWNVAGRAERKAAMRMARTEPATAAGAAAMISHVRRALKTDEEVDWMHWAPLALKTAADALVRMETAT
jgi:hypothetical protein